MEPVAICDRFQPAPQRIFPALGVHRARRPKGGQAPAQRPRRADERLRRPRLRPPARADRCQRRDPQAARRNRRDPASPRRRIARRLPEASAPVAAHAGAAQAAHRISLGQGSVIADQAAREAALDPRRSFIVQAPAGSGKTELLVQRFVNLVSVVEKPEEILAITFTRKAAAEMRSRVLAALETPEIAHRLRIQTIDSLCTALTRQMPVLARFGAQPEILEDASDLYAEPASRTLSELS